MDNQTEQKTAACHIQDSVEYPTHPPWPRHTEILTGIPMAVTGLLGIYTLARTSLPALAVWLVLGGILAYPLRYLVCARCPYYGQSCSTPMGRFIPYLFKKRAGSMKAGLWGDIILGIPLFLIPLACAVSAEAWGLASAWMITSVIALGMLSRFGCKNCPFTFCPVGAISRKIWH